MIDHVLGRPSAKSRRLQVLAVLAFWSTYLARGHKHGPPGTHSLSRFLSRRLTAWQIVTLTMLYLYAARNFSTLVGLASPDPLANMYEATFFRATWVLTALDAGFWTAMKIRSRWLRDLASIVFSGFYLFAAEKADEKVRKVRGNLTVEHLRVSWNKGTTPYLSFLQGLVRPRLTRWPPRLVRIPRPSTSDYQDQPIMAWLYYDGSIDNLRSSGINRVVLDIPGGGFVAMNPRCNDDRLFAWAVNTGLPVLSLDYKKAPEYPFPYALNECYDAYATLVNTRGRCIGLAAHEPVRVVVAGDSAGGNLATAMTLMLAQSSPAALLAPGNKEESPEKDGQNQPKKLPLPDGLVLTYPCLDVNIGNWMSDEQMALIRDRRTRATNKNVLRRKSKQYSDLAGTPHESDDEGLTMTTALPATETNDEGAEASSEEEDGDIIRSQSKRARTPKPAYSHLNVATFRNKIQPPQPHTPKRPTTPAAEKVPELTPAPPATLPTINQNNQTGVTKTTTASYHPEALSTRLATASTISYFNDRVLTPEMMRAMIILYVGPNNRPDFSTNYLLSPVLAPDLLLAHFPKTYFLTGERDPLVDDTVIFSGRLRRVKAAYAASGGRRVEYRESDALAENFDDRDAAEVVLIPGVSHGFLQFPTVYPPAWTWFQRSAQWIEDAFQHADEMRVRSSSGTAPTTAARTRRGRTAKKENGGHYGTQAQTQAKAPAPTEPPKIQVPPPVEPDRVAKNGAGGHSRVHSLARTESSGDESPLEMMRMTKAKGRPESAADSSAKQPSTAPQERDAVAGGRGGDSTSTMGTAGSKSSGAKTASTATTAITTPDVQPSEETKGGNNENANSPSGAASSASAAAAKKKKTAAAARQRARDDKKLVKLASSDDILGRRMQGIVGGLSGMTEE